MKRKLALCAAVLCLTMALSPSAFAAESVVISQSSAPPEVCYPTSVSRSEDGTEIRKYYDLGPEEDPAGIPRSDFEQDGFHYTLIDLLKQELPENESRQHTETVSLESKSKDMESVLALLLTAPDYFALDGKQPDLNSIRADLTALPPRCAPEQKRYVGFWRDGKPEAVLDWVEGYPREQTLWIGFFLVDRALRGQGRTKDTALARQIAMYQIRRMTNLSLKEIGKEFDNRDHTTVLHSIERIEDLIKVDPEKAEIIKDITSNINIRYE